MSINLKFRTPDNAGQCDFPFQTPTWLTNEVLRESDNVKRLLIITEYLESNDDYGHIDIKHILTELKVMLDSKYLELFIT